MLSYSYQWLADDADIAGATAGTYTLTADDEGKTVQVRVSFTDDAGHDETLTSEATDAVAAAPAPNSPATGAPVIGGTPRVGETLTADTSGIEDEDGLDSVSYSYQWMADGADIAGATAGTYTLTADDEGKTVQVRVSFTDDAGHDETLTSEATDAVAAAPAPNSPATGAPVIGGTPRVGETLTADTSGIEDEDGLNNVAYSYQWMADGADIAGATAGTYTLTADDEGKTVQVRVSFTDDAGHDETLTSEATDAVAAAPAPNSPATGAPVIGGTPRVGETLTADTSGIEDEDGLDSVSYSYQWMADGADIAGATAGTYTLTADDEGKTVQVRVSFTDDAGHDETLTSEATDAVAAAPAPNSPATGAPVIGGTPRVGETLTADTSGIEDEDGLDSVSYSYQWMADGADIAGATAGTYTLTADDEGKTVQVRVSFTDDAGHDETLTSEATDAVAAAPAPNSPATGAPVIGGTPRVGETLTADTSGIEDEDGLNNVAYSYQWMADGADIAGATAGTYTLTADDEGKTVQVRVSFTDDAGHDETLTSEATDAVAAAPAPNSPATGAPVIDGTARVGETLTADTSGIEDEDGLDSVSYSYQWLADGADIAGATNSTYTLTADDDGKAIRVRVSFTDDAGHDEALTSQATDAVAAAPAPNSPATGAPVIDGTARVGETLTADTSGIEDEDGLDSVSYSYQWLADGADIAGATNSTYTLTADDDGKAIRVRVSFTDDAGHDEALTSQATDAVAAAPAPNSPATGAPVIDGPKERTANGPSGRPVLTDRE